jgi:hypothetical protein
MTPPTRDVLAKLAQGDPRVIRFLEDLAASDDVIYSADVTATGTLGAEAFAANRITPVNSGGAVVLTIPPGLRPRQMATVLRIGTGAVTFAPGAGVTILSEGGLVAIAARYALVMVRPLAAANSYLLTGRLA